MLVGVDGIAGLLVDEDADVPGVVAPHLVELRHGHAVDPDLERGEGGGDNLALQVWLVDQLIMIVLKGRCEGPVDWKVVGRVAVASSGGDPQEGGGEGGGLHHGAG